ncbi:MAG TPA: glycoside hydrolase family 20 zincin-like fold domain-containing protein, partial [Cyclobacteriaceae bacterium]
MIKFLSFALIIVGIASCTSKQASPDAISRAQSIIPKPVSISVGSNSIRWEEPIAIIAQTEEEKKVAQFVLEFFQMKKIEASIVTESDKDNPISLIITDTPDLGKEGYSLISGEEGVIIKANTSAGLFYGVQSFLQMMT